MSRPPLTSLADGATGILSGWVDPVIKYRPPEMHLEVGALAITLTTQAQ